MFFTDRLMLRGFDPRCDTNIWTQWFNDVTMARSIGFAAARPHSVDDIKALLQKLTKQDGYPAFAVCLRPDKESEPSALSSGQDYYVKEDGSARYPCIGCLNINPARGGVEAANRVVGFGIGLIPDYQGKGYGTEVLRWACSYAFDVLGLHRIELQTNSTNAAARHVYEKVGFVQEGQLRKAIFIDGDYHDMIYLGMLLEDWREMQRSQETTKLSGSR